MNGLLLIGGAKGTGKSTIIRRIEEGYGISTLNTGEIVTYAKRNHLDPEKEIVRHLNRFEGVVDTHYAGYDGRSDFVRGLGKENLSNIKRSIDLILIDADAATIYDRRRDDRTRERILDPQHIARELEMNRYFFKEYCKELGKEGIVVYNQNLEETVRQIAELMRR